MKARTTRQTACLARAVRHRGLADKVFGKLQKKAMKAICQNPEQVRELLRKCDGPSE